MTFKPARFLDPKNDLVFKRIFGQHPDLIKSFLNGVLPFEEGHLIEELEYLTPEQSPRIPTMKNTIADVKCRDQTGKIFIVEMELHPTNTFATRLLFGASRAFVQQMSVGEDYSSLCPVYGLGIVNDVFDRESEEWFHHYRTVNVKDSNKVLKGLELIFLELPKFKQQTFQPTFRTGALIKS
jgi:predicted transposase/invertase (TIGR01784 family)